MPGKTWKMLIDTTSSIVWPGPLHRTRCLKTQKPGLGSDQMIKKRIIDHRNKIKNKITSQHKMNPAAAAAAAVGTPMPIARIHP